jgi:hypothetical protein
MIIFYIANGSNFNHHVVRLRLIRYFVDLPLLAADVSDALRCNEGSSASPAPSPSVDCRLVIRLSYFKSVSTSIAAAGVPGSEGEHAVSRDAGASVGRLLPP